MKELEIRYQRMHAMLRNFHKMDAVDRTWLLARFSTDDIEMKAPKMKPPRKKKNK